jgi:hypothetical protein
MPMIDNLIPSTIMIASLCGRLPFWSRSEKPRRRFGLAPSDPK